MSVNSGDYKLGQMSSHISKATTSSAIAGRNSVQPGDMSTLRNQSMLMRPANMLSPLQKQKKMLEERMRMSVETRTVDKDEFDDLAGP